MRVLEVITGLSKATGTSEFFVESVWSLIRQGVNVDVVCRVTWGHDLGSAPVYSSLSEYDAAIVNNLVPLPDIVHVHALWAPFLAVAHRWARRHKIPVVVSTHGSLSPWAMASKRWKKLPYWLFVEKPELKKAAAFHVTADLEGKWVRDFGFKQPLINVPLGVGVPQVFGGEKLVGGKRVILMVGRIYEVKGLDRIARAIRLLKDGGKWSGWRMIMAGPNWMNYQPQLESLIDELGLRDDIALPGAVYGEDKEKLFRQASIYISASHTENFCQPVAEALTYGVPAIASKGTPWNGLNTHTCGIWTENDPESLAKALEDLMGMSDEERLAMGLRGRKWMQEDFSWDSIGKKLLAEFEKISRGRV